jgi:hypothetical protein
MPLQATSGAASQDAYGGNGVAVVPTYIEDVFSTWLYAGNGGTPQTITNGIDLAGKGGFVWVKDRTFGSYHSLFSTATGVNQRLFSNDTTELTATANSLTAFNSTGFSVGTAAATNAGSTNYVSWSLRKQPKFFDVVTWSGDGTGNRSIPHLLGSTPGFIQTKQTNGTESWWNHHRSVTSPNANWWRNYGALNSVNSFADWGDNSGLYQAPDANNLYIGSYYNASGKTYVAYLFAHDSGGFGLSGSENVISCGSFTTSGSGAATVTLGYEPQWVLFKCAGSADNWIVLDNMRKWSNNGSTGSAAYLYPNTSGAEGTAAFGFPTATGFQVSNQANSVGYIYIAIRRGPMKVPTTGTSVFEPVTRTGTGANATVTTAISPVDMVWAFARSGGLGAETIDFDRLRGALRALYTGTTAAEFSATNTLTGFDVQNGYRLGSDSSGYGINYSSFAFINYNFKRAPGFFDEVCYTGTGSATTVSHNLQAVPELMITKCRGDAFGWAVYSSAVGNTAALFLETTAIPDTNSAYWNNTTPTSTVFSVGSANRTNRTSLGMVAYLFATCAGVSKVFSYTGNGSSQTINCGFTGGARFVLIKRTDSAGDWYVWDTARGIVSGNDPHLSLNTTAAEVTTDDTIDTDSTGFVVNQVAATNVNVSSATYIGLAVA